MKYDVAIIGGGPGGYVAAIRAAQLGGRVLLAEKENLGGVCLNKGCIPTKTLLKCSGAYNSLKDLSMFGINAEKVSVDFKRMMARKQEVVSTLVNGIQGLMKANGVEVLTGEGSILDASHIMVAGKAYEADNIIIATGSKPFMPEIKGIEALGVIDSDALLSMDALPASITVIGGGVIGTEFAILLSELDCSVTVIEMMDDILYTADRDVIKEVRNILIRHGVKIITSARVTEINGNNVIYEKDGKAFSVRSDKILVASGRIPSMDVAQLDRLGIKHERGRIVTDERLRTNVRGIYAIGDANGKYMLAHVASEEGIIAVENVFGHDRRMSYKNIPQCIYSHPEAAWTGMTEKEAREMGYDISIGKFSMSANGKSLAEGDAKGFVKVIIDKRYKEILGVHMVCAHATDMIAEGVLAINLEATAGEVANTIHPHPTVSESVMEAFNAALGSAIHAAGR